MGSMKSTQGMAWHGKFQKAKFLGYPGKNNISEIKSIANRFGLNCSYIIHYNNVDHAIDSYN